MQVIEKQISKQIDHMIYGAIGTLLVITSLSGLGLVISDAFATSTAFGATSNTASVTVAASCSMTANTSTAHTATLPNGVWSGGEGYYPSGIGSTTITTLCNDPNGYAIYAVGFTGNSMTGNNTVLEGNNSSNIATGTATSGNTSNWAMKLTAISSTSTTGKDLTPTILSDTNGSFASYHAVPATYTKVANYASNTDGGDNAVGSSITTTYGAFISGGQPAGTYVGKVKYTLVHPGTATDPEIDTMQHVAYWGNSLVVGEEATVEDARDQNTYTVARLCTNYSGDNCTSSQLWMTQNLDLQIGGRYDSNNDGVKDAPIILNSENTNLTTAYAADGTTLLNGYSVDSNTGVITWTPAGNATVTGTPATISDFEHHSAEATNVTGWITDNYSPSQAEGQLNGNDVYMYTSDNTSYDIVYDTLSACTTAGHSTAKCAHYKIGNYYNFAAASAMNDSTAFAAQYTVVPNSICPTGWRLPKGLTSDGSTVTMSEFNKLLIAQGVTDGTDLSGGTDAQFTINGFNMIRTTGKNGDPLYFIRSGDVDGTTLWNTRTYGYYWSSTVATPSVRGYYLFINSSSVSPASRYYRSSGGSVRCVADL